MSEAIKIADMICIMDGGNIVQYDTPENILKYPINSFVAEFVGKNRIWTSPEFIKSEDIMIENPVTCHRNMELFKCIETMRHSKVDSLMVIDTKTRFLEGIITAKEIQGVADKSKPVNTVMRTRFPSVSNDDNIIQVLKTVDSHNVSDIPVLNNKGILLGLITKSSLITTLSQQYLESEVS